MRQTAARNTRQSGFTILEMLAAVALLSIMSLIGVPRVTAVFDEYQLVGTANQLAFEISRARMEAIGQSAYVRIRFTNSTQYVRERSTDGVNYTVEAGPTTMPTGITKSGDGGYASFNPSGLAIATSPMTLRSAHGSKTVRANSLGRVTVS
jgi:prepilin-type N-terminal cleavage/methylation domain-containing protein